MPKILPSLVAPAPKAAAADESSRALQPRKPAANRGGFDEALNGARKKAPAAQPAERNSSAERTERRERADGEAPAKRVGRGERGERAQRSNHRGKAEKPDPAEVASSDHAAAADDAAGAEGTERRDDGANPTSDGGAEPRPASPAANARSAVHPDTSSSEILGVEQVPDAAAKHPSRSTAAPAIPEIALPTLSDVAAEAAPGADLETEADRPIEHPATSGDIASLLQPPISGEPGASQEDLATSPDAEGLPAGLVKLAPSDVAKPTDVTSRDGDTSPVGQGTAAATGAAPKSGVNVGGDSTAATSHGDNPAEPAQAEERPSAEAAMDKAGAAGVIEGLDTADADARQQMAPPAPSTAAAATPLTSSGSDVPQQGTAGVILDAPKQSPAGQGATSAALPPVAPEVRFAEDNHANIVREMRGQLMPDGGTMRIRLDPPELGPLAVTVRLRNGVMEASFEASSDEAAKLLSHSLGTLRTSLESQGVHVERLQVQQAPKDQQAGSQQEGGREQQRGQDRDFAQDHSARQEQQRREMLRRMWRKLSGTDDSLDMVA